MFKTQHSFVLKFICSQYMQNFSESLSFPEELQQLQANETLKIANFLFFVFLFSFSYWSSISNYNTILPKVSFSGQLKKLCFLTIAETTSERTFRKRRAFFFLFVGWDCSRKSRPSSLKMFWVFNHSSCKKAFKSNEPGTHPQNVHAPRNGIYPQLCTTKTPYETASPSAKTK